MTKPVHILALMLSLFFGSPTFSQSHWTWRNPLPTNNSLHSVIWTGNQWVAVGEQGTILTSKDGVSWTARDSKTSVHLQSVCWTGGQLVAVGDSGTALTSPDGIGWERRNSGTGRRLNSIAWTGNRLVAVGDSGVTTTSQNAIEWQAYNPNGSSSLRSIIWTGTQLVAVGDFIKTSVNGDTWKYPTGSTKFRLNSVAWSGSSLAAVGEQGDIFSSLDGITWIAGSSDLKTDLRTIAWVGTEFQVLSDTSGYIVSKDGLAWENRTFNADFTAYYLFMSQAWNGEKMVAVGLLGGVLNSVVGGSWVMRSSGSRDWYVTVAWTGNQLVALGSNYDKGNLAGSSSFSTSPDGVTWSTRILGSSDTGLVRSVVWDGNQYVAVGEHDFDEKLGFKGGIIKTSKDGTVWNTLRVGPKNELRAVVWTGKRLLAVGGDTAFVSSDAVNWTRHNMGLNTDGMRAVVWTGDQFVAVGSAIMKSPDGVNWTRVSDKTLSLTSVAWSGTRLVAVGFNGQCMTSENGSDWVAHPFNFPYLLNSITYTGKQFVAVGSGQGGEVLSSPDGIAWTRHASPSTQTLFSVTWTGAQLVAVGPLGIIVTSPEDMNSGIMSVTTMGRRIDLKVMPTYLNVTLPSAFSGKKAIATLSTVMGKKIVETVVINEGSGFRIPINGIGKGRYFLDVMGGEFRLGHAFTVSR